MDKEKARREDPFMDVIRLIVRRRWIFFVSSIVIMIVVLLGSLFVPLKYTAVATFESRTDPIVEFSSDTKEQTFRVAKMTLREELAGVSAVKEAIDELKLPYESEEEKDAIARLFSNRIRIYWRVNTDNVDLVQVEFSHSDPAVAQALPNILVRNYIKRVSQRILDQLYKSREFVVSQVKVSDEKIAELKRKEIEIVSKYGLDIGDKPSYIRDQIIRVNTEIENLRRQKSIAEAKVLRLQRLLRTAHIRDLEEKRNSIENELSILLNEYCMSEHHPKVIALKIRLKEIDEKIKEAREIENPEDLRLDERISAILSDIAIAKSEVATIDAEIQRLIIKQQKYEELLSNLTPILSSYSYLESQLKEELQINNRWRSKLAALNSAIEAEEEKYRTQLSTVQPAKSPYRPVSPRLWTILFFAVAGGLTFGYVISFAAENVDHTIRSPEELASALGSPVLGVIDEILTTKESVLRGVRRKTIATIVVALLLCGLLLSAAVVTLRIKYPAKYQKIVSIVDNQKTVLTGYILPGWENK